jgi:hypothetical protein
VQAFMLFCRPSVERGPEAVYLGTGEEAYVRLCWEGCLAAHPCVSQGVCRRSFSSGMKCKLCGPWGLVGARIPEGFLLVSSVVPKGGVGAGVPAFGSCRGLHVLKARWCSLPFGRGTAMMNCGGYRGPVGWSVAAYECMKCTTLCRACRAWVLPACAVLCLTAGIHWSRAVRYVPCSC